MKICVLGLWHLGSVTAAGLAHLGHEVVGLDFDPAIVAGLSAGSAPVFEPGLDELIGTGLAAGHLRFVAELDAAVGDIDVLWVTHDTPVDADDVADSDYVEAQIERVLLGLNADVLVLVSAQLPVGSMRRLEQSAASPGAAQQSRRVAYCPENLRLGSAVKDFLHPTRIVAGFRSGRDQALLTELLSALSRSIEWMSVESAEMTKHALNAFLATSVAFANEIASICEAVGADAKEVERGLKSESRIGPRAYLSPGAAFAGGTLARDVRFLNRTSLERGVVTPLLSAVLPSNEAHKHWARNKLRGLFPDLSGTTVAVWGLTYKPGTDTLRRSMAVDLCDWLLQEGATVRVHDPKVKLLPDNWLGIVTRYDDPIAAAQGVDALVVGTEWPDYHAVSADQLRPRGERLVMLDANRFLVDRWSASSHVHYFAVGTPDGSA